MAGSAAVNAVSRRNKVGGKRSTAPSMTPWVSRVSTSPSTSTESSVNGPAAANVWVRLPNASSWLSSRHSCDTSMRQSMTYWPSWLRGVRRSTWMTPAGGLS